MFKLCFQYTGIAGVATVSSLTASVSSTPCVQVCHNDVMEVVLNCWARGGYGLILQRNPVVSENPTRAPLCVTYIEKGSPADKSGILHVGDRVLAINDWCTAKGTAEEANYIVRHATGPLTLTVEFDVIDAALPSNGVFTIKLAKKGQNLGVGIASTATSQKGDPVVVSDVRTGSVAHRCGAIQVGDQLLAIDNIPLDTCTVEEATRLLQRSPDTVKLRIKKNSVADDLESAGGTNSLTGQQVIAYTVELSRKIGPLGLTIAGTDDRFDPIFISQLAPGGLADKTGAVRVGDRILAINGQSLQGKRVSEALQILHLAGDTLSLRVARTLPSSAISLGEHSLSRAGLPHHHIASTYGPSLLTTVGSDRVPSIFHEHFNERCTADKLGTPVQSIDSAVESLEDASLTDSQQPSAMASNRTSQNSKSSSLSGGPHSDVALYGLSAEELSAQLQRTLNAIKVASNGGGASQGSRQSDAGSSSVSNAATDDEHYAQMAGAAESCLCAHHSSSGQSQEEWVRVLEALESVGEAEMLKKVEESAGCTYGSIASPSSTPDSTLPSLPPKPPPKPHLTPPFPVSNNLLKPTYSSASRLVSTSYLSMAQDSRPIVTIANSGASASLSRDAVSMAASSLTASLASGSSSSFGPVVAPSAICSVPRPLSVSTILSGYEHIPFISTPVPSRASSTAPAPNLIRRPTSPDPSSSIQLSGSATPMADAVLERDVIPSRLLLPAAPGSGPGETNSMPLEIFRVQLAKDKVYNDFGFSVSDGVQDKGVYINKIRSGGPADLSGSIRPLDRILQVNGSSLLDLDCMLAVPMLAAAGDQIDLVFCRDPILAATFRGAADSIEEEDEEEAESAFLVGQTTV